MAPGEDLGHDYVGTGHMLLGMLAGATVPPPGSSGSAGATVPPPGSSGSAGLGEASGRPLVLARIAERRE